MGTWTRGAAVAVVLAATMLAVLAMPASAGTTQISGKGEFDPSCEPPQSAGGPQDPPDFYPPIEMAGDLVGCWYTDVPARSKLNPSGTYQEKGTELFVGCYMDDVCGTFSTTYTFTAKYVDETFMEEIHGRCQHPIVSGTGDFAGVDGVVLFKDDVVNFVFDYRGHIRIG
jgi:hypothetical protein